MPRTCDRPPRVPLLSLCAGVWVRASETRRCNQGIVVAVGHLRA